jgi:hypothetical protein
VALIIACGALALATMLYVFWVTPEPIVRKSHAQAEHDFLDERKEMVYEGMRDLQMEYRMGKLSDADYQELKLSYQHQLAQLLDEASRISEAPAPPPDTATPEAVVPGRCQICGQDNPATNRFCGSCGKELKTAEVNAR